MQWAVKMGLKPLSAWALACSALMLQACGGDSSSTPASATSAAAVAAQQQATTMYRSAVYNNLNNWLCHPELEGLQNACEGQQRTLSVAQDGQTRTTSLLPRKATDADCFYLYPTTSLDVGLNSDRIATLQERVTAFQQVGPFREDCRVFAPVYRQRTLTALAISTQAQVFTPEQIAAADELAYADVLDSFKHYMANHNQGRGVLLIGHSQGSRLLARLIADDIEPREEWYRKLIAAYIPGFTVLQPVGQDVGGTFARTPPCKSKDQTQCAVGFVTYRQGDPQLANPRFGKSPNPGQLAMCVNPAELSGSQGLANAQIPFILPPIFNVLLIPRGEGGPYSNPVNNLTARLSSEFYAVPGQLAARCVVDPRSRANHLEFRVLPEAQGVRASDYPGEFLGGPDWGLHLPETNLFMGDLVTIFKSQKQAHLAKQGSATSQSGVNP